MSFKFTPVQLHTILSQELKTVAERGRILAAVIATIASRIPGLPGAAQDDPTRYYVLTVEDQVKTLLSDFNECVIFEVGYALTLARQFWLLRYRSAYPDRASYVCKKYDFFCNLNGTESMVGGADYAWLTEHKEEIFNLAWSITEACEVVDSDGEPV